MTAFALSALLVMSISASAEASDDRLLAQTPSWLDQFKLADGTYADGVIVDATGLYVLGSTYTDPAPGSTATEIDLFLRRYNTAGTELWTVVLGGPGWDLSGGFTADDVRTMAVTNPTRLIEE